MKSGIYDGATDPLPDDDLLGTAIEAKHQACVTSLNDRTEKLASEWAAYLAHPSQERRP